MSQHRTTRAMVLKNGRVVLTDRIEAGLTVVISEGKIRSVGSDSEALRLDGAEVIDCAGACVAPGLIDLHVHGGNGSDFMDAEEDGYRTIGAYHAAHGTTAYYVTTACDSTESYLKVIELARAFMSDPRGGPEVLGVHWEGPYFAMEMKGCHLSEHVRDPDPAEYGKIFEHADVVRHVTIAPELPGALECIRAMAAKGITPAAAHSLAEEKHVDEAIEAGLKHGTHIYSAMSMLKRVGPYRVLGLVEKTLVDERLTTEMIADGKHLPASLMKLIYKCKGPDRLCIVSDAMRGAGRPSGETHAFGPRNGHPTVIEDGVAMTPDRKWFASSITPLLPMVRNVVEMVGVPLHESVRMASLTPAKVAGVDGRKGSLEAGKDADVVVFGEDYRAVMTIAQGEVIYRA